MTPAQDRRWMQLALMIGRRGQGRVWPNPAVGCVVVQGGRVIGRGRTADGGRPHAEVVALSQAGVCAKGATAYVTLEPCAHQGQTGPCSAALIAAGVARVVVACTDPDPRVAGQGLAQLRAAGIAVDLGICEAEARADHAGFFGRLVQQPFVTLKLASTLDGRIATAHGESQWITGPQARTRVHAMRARHDAVMVGAGTARDDDPMLTVRGMGAVPQPVRIVVSSGLDLPIDGQLARTATDTPVWLCHTAADPDRIAAWQERGAECIACEAEGGSVALRSVLSQLAQRGITRIFCEGGGTLAAALMSANLVDDLVVFSAGAVMGSDGRPAVGPLRLDRLGDAPRFDLSGVERVGDDVMTRWHRQR